MNKIFLAFDLDDTLYDEIDFLKSGYREIARDLSKNISRQNEIYDFLLETYRKGGNPFDELKAKYGVSYSKNELIELYRFHKPVIFLKEGVKDTLKFFKSQANFDFGIITDGRTVTQKNKIEALGLYDYFKPENIIISEEFGSEKPAEQNFRYFMLKYPETNSFIYVGDNVKKDFITPKKLGWKTIGISDRGNNIHRQYYIDEVHEPSIWISEYNELKNFII